MADHSLNSKCPKCPAVVKLAYQSLAKSLEPHVSISINDGTQEPQQVNGFLSVHQQAAEVLAQLKR